MHLICRGTQDLLQSPAKQGYVAKQGDAPKKTLEKQKQGDAPKKTSEKQKQGDAPKKTSEKQKQGDALKMTSEKQKQGDAPKKTSEKQKQGDAPKKTSAKQKQGDAPKMTSEKQKQGDAPKKTLEKQKQGDAPKKTSEKQKQGDAPKKMSEKQKQGDTPKITSEKQKQGDAPKMTSEKQKQGDASKMTSEKQKQGDAPKKTSEKQKQGYALKDLQEDTPKKSAKQGDMSVDMPAKQDNAPRKLAKKKTTKSAKEGDTPKEQQEVPVKQGGMSKKAAKYPCVPQKRMLFGKNNSPGKSLNPPFLEYLCVVDFEATCEKGQREYQHEIIEFPVVLVNLHKRCVEGYFREYVRPLVIPQLTDYCIELTGIKQEVVDGAETFPTVLLHAVEWMQQLGLGTRHTFCFLTDGSYDMSRFLYQQCKLSSLKFPTFARRWINVRKSFSRFAKVPKNTVQLKCMLEKFGLQFEGRPHSGLDDAKNIARIALELADRGMQLLPNEALEMDKDLGRIVSLQGAEQLQPVPSVRYPKSR
uniref:Exoribonuclease 1 n=1 Tax=Eptatretus burgeri TaxID=7764 RepID=A0A8C4R751_EPTBU